MSEKKKSKSSPDYSQLGQKMLEGSGDGVISKLPAGLYVVATPIGHMGDITLRALVTLASVDTVACEDTRVTGGLLNAFGLKKDLMSCHDHNEQGRLPQIIKQIQEGAAVALTSDAGLPLIADPGFRLVQGCLAANIPVTVIPGANAALTALAGSGLATDAFHFAGFLPAKSGARTKALDALKTIPATLIFYESPQRLTDMLHDAASALGGGRKAAVARELTKLHEETRMDTLDDLHAHYVQNLPKGEIVVLIAPPEQLAEAVSEQDMDMMLQSALSNHSLRDAVEIVSEATSRKRSEIYSRALWLNKKGS